MKKFVETIDYLVGRIVCELHAAEVDDPLGNCFNGHIANIKDLQKRMRLLTQRTPDARKSAPKSRSKNSKGSAKPARG